MYQVTRGEIGPDEPMYLYDYNNERHLRMDNHLRGFDGFTIALCTFSLIAIVIQNSHRLCQQRMILIIFIL